MKAPRYVLSLVVVLLLAGLGIWRLGYEAGHPGIYVYYIGGRDPFGDVQSHFIPFNRGLSLEDAIAHAHREWAQADGGGGTQAAAKSSVYSSIILKRWPTWSSERVLHRVVPWLLVCTERIGWTAARNRVEDWLRVRPNFGDTAFDIYPDPEASKLLRPGDVIGLVP